METTYKKIRPADVYLSIQDKEPADAGREEGNIPNKYGNRDSGNDFIDLFAGIVRKYGHISTAEYARMLNLSPNELSVTIRALTGMSFRDWRDEYLRMACCELLEETKLNIMEISERMGFTSIYVFSRFFQNVQKYQPTEWRIYKQTGKRKKFHHYD